MTDKQKLQQSIRAKITTTMIGALDSFEKGFGRLWGHEKEGEFTEQEERFYNIWLEVREVVLDKGNAQIGGANKEIDNYDVSRQRYEVKFYNRRENGRD